MQKITLVTALALATAACSATSTALVTHAWNAEDKTTAEYRLDISAVWTAQIQPKATLCSMIPVLTATKTAC